MAFCCTKHCCGVNEQKALWISVLADDWKAEWAIIASYEFMKNGIRIQTDQEPSRIIR